MGKKVQGAGSGGNIIAEGSPPPPKGTMVHHVSFAVPKSAGGTERISVQYFDATTKEANKYLDNEVKQGRLVKVKLTVEDKGEVKVKTVYVRPEDQDALARYQAHEQRDAVDAFVHLPATYRLTMKGRAHAGGERPSGVVVYPGMGGKKPMFYIRADGTAEEKKTAAEFLAKDPRGFVAVKFSKSIIDPNQTEPPVEGGVFWIPQATYDEMRAQGDTTVTAVPADEVQGMFFKAPRKGTEEVKQEPKKEEVKGPVSGTDVKVVKGEYKNTNELITAKNNLMYSIATEYDKSSTISGISGALPANYDVVVTAKLDPKGNLTYSHKVNFKEPLPDSDTQAKIKNFVERELDKWTGIGPMMAKPDGDVQFQFTVQVRTAE